MSVFGRDHDNFAWANDVWKKVSVDSIPVCAVELYEFAGSFGSLPLSFSEKYLQSVKSGSILPSTAIYEVENCVLTRGEELYFLNEKLLAGADQLGFPIGVQILEMHHIAGHSDGPEGFLFKDVRASRDSFLQSARRFVTGYLKAGFAISQLVGLERAHILQESTFDEIVEAEMEDCLRCLVVSTTQSDVAVTSSSFQMLVDLGWIPTDNFHIV